jgi:hypothetical protein
MTNSTMSTVTRVGSNRAGTFADMSQSISAGVSEAFSRNRNSSSKEANNGRPVTMTRAVANSINVYFRRFMEALHESRRQQAELILRRHRHLICTDDTRNMFKNQRDDK